MNNEKFKDIKKFHFRVKHKLDNTIEVNITANQLLISIIKLPEDRYTV